MCLVSTKWYTGGFSACKLMSRSQMPLLALWPRISKPRRERQHTSLSAAAGSSNVWNHVARLSPRFLTLPWHLSFRCRRLEMEPSGRGPAPTAQFRIPQMKLCCSAISSSTSLELIPFFAYVDEMLSNWIVVTTIIQHSKENKTEGQPQRATKR